MSRIAQPEQRWLVCYDITQPRRRRRVAGMLLACGQRVQKSVFICTATPHAMASTQRRCTRTLAVDDQLSVYPLLAHGPVTIGTATVETRVPGYWLC